jgi:predicted transcriptional regulator
MKLAAPTDFELLRALSDGKRNNAANLSIELGRNRSYINTRLPILADYGLVERIGPSERSGLYEITAAGTVVVDHWVEHEDPDADFDALVRSELDDGEA